MTPPTVSPPPPTHRDRFGQPIDLAEVLAPYSQTEHALYRRGHRDGFWHGVFASLLGIGLWVMGGLLYWGVIS